MDQNESKKEQAKKEVIDKVKETQQKKSDKIVGIERMDVADDILDANKFEDMLRKAGTPITWKTNSPFALPDPFNEIRNERSSASVTDPQYASEYDLGGDEEPSDPDLLRIVGGIPAGPRPSPRSRVSSMDDEENDDTPYGRWGDQCSSR